MRGRDAWETRGGQSVDGFVATSRVWGREGGHAHALFFLSPLLGVSPGDPLLRVKALAAASAAETMTTPDPKSTAAGASASLDFAG